MKHHHWGRSRKNRNKRNFLDKIIGSHNTNQESEDYEVATDDEVWTLHFGNRPTTVAGSNTVPNKQENMKNLMAANTDMESNASDQNSLETTVEMLNKPEVTTEKFKIQFSSLKPEDSSISIDNKATFNYAINVSPFGANMNSKYQEGSTINSHIGEIKTYSPPVFRFLPLTTSSGSIFDTDFKASVGPSFNNGIKVYTPSDVLLITTTDQTNIDIENKGDSYISGLKQYSPPVFATLANPISTKTIVVNEFKTATMNSKILDDVPEAPTIITLLPKSSASKNGDDFQSKLNENEVFLEEKFTIPTDKTHSKEEEVTVTGNFPSEAEFSMTTIKIPYTTNWKPTPPDHLPDDQNMLTPVDQINFQETTGISIIDQTYDKNSVNAGSTDEYGKLQTIQLVADKTIRIGKSSPDVEKTTNALEEDEITKATVEYMNDDEKDLEDVDAEDGPKGKVKGTTILMSGKNMSENSKYLASVDEGSTTIPTMFEEDEMFLNAIRVSTKKHKQHSNKSHHMWRFGKKSKTTAGLYNITSVSNELLNTQDIDDALLEKQTTSAKMFNSTTITDKLTGSLNSKSITANDITSSLNGVKEITENVESTILHTSAGTTVPITESLTTPAKISTEKLYEASGSDVENSNTISDTIVLTSTKDSTTNSISATAVTDSSTELSSSSISASETKISESTSTSLSPSSESVIIETTTPFLVMGTSALMGENTSTQSYNSGSNDTTTESEFQQNQTEGNVSYTENNGHNENILDGDKNVSHNEGSSTGDVSVSTQALLDITTTSSLESTNTESATVTTVSENDLSTTSVAKNSSDSSGILSTVATAVNLKEDKSSALLEISEFGTSDSTLSTTTQQQSSLYFSDDTIKKSTLFPETSTEGSGAESLNTNVVESKTTESLSTFSNISTYTKEDSLLALQNFQSPSSLIPFVEVNSTTEAAEKTINVITTMDNSLNIFKATSHTMQPFEENEFMANTYSRNTETYFTTEQSLQSKQFANGIETTTNAIAMIDDLLKIFQSSTSPPKNLPEILKDALASAKLNQNHTTAFDLFKYLSTSPQATTDLITLDSYSTSLLNLLQDQTTFGMSIFLEPTTTTTTSKETTLIPSSTNAATSLSMVSDRTHKLELEKIPGTVSTVLTGSTLKQQEQLRTTKAPNFPNKPHKNDNFNNKLKEHHIHEAYSSGSGFKAYHGKYYIGSEFIPEHGHNSSINIPTSNTTLRNKISVTNSEFKKLTNAEILTKSFSTATDTIRPNVKFHFSNKTHAEAKEERIIVSSSTFTVASTDFVGSEDLDYGNQDDSGNDTNITEISKTSVEMTTELLKTTVEYVEPKTKTTHKHKHNWLGRKSKISTLPPYVGETVTSPDEEEDLMDSSQLTNSLIHASEYTTEGKMSSHNTKPSTSSEKHLTLITHTSSESETEITYVFEDDIYEMPNEAALTKTKEYVSTTSKHENTELSTTKYKSTPSENHDQNESEKHIPLTTYKHEDDAINTTPNKQDTHKMHDQSNVTLDCISCHSNETTITEAEEYLSSTTNKHENNKISKTTNISGTPKSNNQSNETSITQSEEYNSSTTQIKISTENRISQKTNTVQESTPPMVIENKNHPTPSGDNNFLHEKISSQFLNVDDVLESSVGGLTMQTSTKGVDTLNSNIPGIDSQVLDASDHSKSSTYFISSNTEESRFSSTLDNGSSVYSEIISSGEINNTSVNTETTTKKIEEIFTPSNIDAEKPISETSEVSKIGSESLILSGYTGSNKETKITNIDSETTTSETYTISNIVSEYSTFSEYTGNNEQTIITNMETETSMPETSIVSEIASGYPTFSDYTSSKLISSKINDTIVSNITERTEIFKTASEILEVVSTSFMESTVSRYDIENKISSVFDETTGLTLNQDDVTDFITDIFLTKTTLPTYDLENKTSTDFLETTALSENQGNITTFIADILLTETSTNMSMESEVTTTNENQPFFNSSTLIEERSTTLNQVDSLFTSTTSKIDDQLTTLFSSLSVYDSTENILNSDVEPESNNFTIILSEVGSIATTRDPVAHDMYMLTEGATKSGAPILSDFDNDEKSTYFILKPTTVARLPEELDLELLTTKTQRVSDTKSAINNEATIPKSWSHGEEQTLSTLKYSPSTLQKSSVKSSLETSTESSVISTSIELTTSTNSIMLSHLVSESTQKSESEMTFSKELTQTTNVNQPTEKNRINGTKSIKNALNKMIDKIKHIGHTDSTSNLVTTVDKHTTNTSTSRVPTTPPNFKESANAIIINDSVVETTNTPTIFWGINTSNAEVMTISTESSTIVGSPSSGTVSETSGNINTTVMHRSEIDIFSTTLSTQTEFLSSTIGIRTPTSSVTETTLSIQQTTAEVKSENGDREKEKISTNSSILFQKNATSLGTAFFPSSTSNTSETELINISEIPSNTTHYSEITISTIFNAPSADLSTKTETEISIGNAINAGAVNITENVSTISMTSENSQLINLNFVEKMISTTGSEQLMSQSASNIMESSSKQFEGTDANRVTITPVIMLFTPATGIVSNSNEDISFPVNIKMLLEAAEKENHASLVSVTTDTAKSEGTGITDSTKSDVISTKLDKTEAGTFITESITTENRLETATTLSSSSTRTSEQIQTDEENSGNGTPERTQSEGSQNMNMVDLNSRQQTSTILQISVTTNAVTESSEIITTTTKVGTSTKTELPSKENASEYSTDTSRLSTPTSSTLAESVINHISSTTETETPFSELTTQIRTEQFTNSSSFQTDSSFSSTEVYYTNALENTKLNMNTSSNLIDSHSTDSLTSDETIFSSVELGSSSTNTEYATFTISAIKSNLVTEAVITQQSSTTEYSTQSAEVSVETPSDTLLTSSGELPTNSDVTNQLAQSSTTLHSKTSSSTASDSSTMHVNSTTEEISYVTNARLHYTELPTKPQETTTEILTNTEYATNTSIISTIESIASIQSVFTQQSPTTEFSIQSTESTVEIPSDKLITSSEELPTNADVTNQLTQSSTTLHSKTSSSSASDSSTMHVNSTTEEISYVTNARLHYTELPITKPQETTTEILTNTEYATNTSIISTIESIASIQSVFTQQSPTTEFSIQSTESTVEIPSDKLLTSSEELPTNADVTNQLTQSSTTLHSKTSSSSASQSSTLHINSTTEEISYVTNARLHYTDSPITKPVEITSQILTNIGSVVKDISTDKTEFSQQSDITKLIIGSSTTEAIYTNMSSTKRPNMPKVLFSTNGPVKIEEQNQNLNMHHMPHNSPTSTPTTTKTTANLSTNMITEGVQENTSASEAITKFTSTFKTKTSSTSSNETCRYTPVDRSNSFNMTTSTDRTYQPVYIDLPTYLPNSSLPVPNFEQYYTTLFDDYISEDNESFDQTLNSFAFREMKLADFNNVTEFVTTTEFNAAINVSVMTMLKRTAEITNATKTLSIETTTTKTSAATTVSTTASSTMISTPTSTESITPGSTFTSTIPSSTTSLITTTSAPKTSSGPTSTYSLVTIANVAPTCNGDSSSHSKPCNIDKDQHTCICSVDSIVKDLQEKSRYPNINSVLTNMCEIYIPLNSTGIKVGRCANRQRRNLDDYDMDAQVTQKPKREVIASVDIKDAFSKDIDLEETEAHKFATIGSTVRMICADGKNFSSKDYNMRWTIGKDTPLTGSKTQETVSGDLIIANIEPSDGGNYTCSVTNHQVGMRTFRHELSVISLPTMDINTTILYEINVDCLKEDEDLLRLYFNTAIGNMLCGKEHRICAIDIVNCSCINKHKKFISIALVFHIEEMHVIVPTLNTTQCNVLCQMKIYSKLISVIVNNILVFETQPVIYKHSRDVTLTPSKDSTLASYEITETPKLILACAAGYGLLGDKHICSACDKNTYNNGGLARCMPCPPRHYQPYSGSRTCFKCTSPFQDPACMNMMVLNVKKYKYYAYGALVIMTSIVLCIICMRCRRSKKHDRQVKIARKRKQRDIEMHPMLTYETREKETLTQLSVKTSNTRKKRRFPKATRAPPIPHKQDKGTTTHPAPIARITTYSNVNKRVPPTPPPPDF